MNAQLQPRTTPMLLRACPNFALTHHQTVFTPCSLCSSELATHRTLNLPLRHRGVKTSQNSRT